MPRIKRPSFGVLTLLLALLTAGLGLPQSVRAQPTYLTINPGGGQTLDDGLRITVGNGRYQVERNGKPQLYLGDDGIENGTMTWILVVGWDAGAGYDAGHACVGSTNGDVFDNWDCVVPDTPVMNTANQQIWTDGAISEVSQSGDTTVVAMAMQDSFDQIAGKTCDLELSTTISYTSPNPFADVSAQLDTDGADCGLITSANLYLVADMLLDGNDYGPSKLTTWQGERVVAQFNQTGVGGFREVGTPWDSYAGAEFPCLYGATDTVPLRVTFNCYDTAYLATVGSRGLHYNERLPNTLDGNETDAGVGVQFDLTGNLSRKVETQIFFMAKDAYTATADLGGEEVIAECELTPDMAVSPQYIYLTPGETATVEVALRNLCDDAPYADADLLVSFSDGLTVIDGSPNMLNLGQRAAWQGFTLAPGETRKWTVTVKSAATLAAAPVHIHELYHRGGVARRIDGVFITPAPTPAPAPVVEAPAVVPAAPAALPVSLPNTSGGATLPLLLAVGAGLSALQLGRSLKRRK